MASISYKIIRQNASKNSVGTWGDDRKSKIVIVYSRQRHLPTWVTTLLGINIIDDLLRKSLRDETSTCAFNFMFRMFEPSSQVGLRFPITHPDSCALSGGIYQRNLVVVIGFFLSRWQKWI